MARYNRRAYSVNASHARGYDTLRSPAGQRHHAHVSWKPCDSDEPEPQTKPTFGFSTTSHTDNTPRERSTVTFGFTSTEGAS